MNILLLSSGFFLGWSLGANDGGNIFGPAVGTRMLRFKFAAILASIFIVIGAVFQGGGATQTLSSLGSVNQLPGSFTVALAAAISLFLMVKAKIPVSSSQAVVGAILGWNLFSSSFTNSETVVKIVSTWVMTPILSGTFAIILFYLFNFFLNKKAVSMLKQDYYTRVGYVLLVAFSAYSLGANNIANVMGMFVDSAPFTPITFFDRFVFTSHMQLFFLGGVSISVGILTRSMSNAQTVGSAIFKMSPITGFIAILSSSIVLFIFSSKHLQVLLVQMHLPTLPLVPVSSSQAIVGAIIGLGIVKGANQIQYRNLSKIAIGWVINPLLAGAICFVSLFFVQNVFDQRVFTPTVYVFNQAVITKLDNLNFDASRVMSLDGSTFETARCLRHELRINTDLNVHEKAFVADKAELYPMFVTSHSLLTIRSRNHFPEHIFNPLLEIEFEVYDHKWQLVDRLSELSEEWRYKPRKIVNDFYNNELDKRYEVLFRMFIDIG